MTTITDWIESLSSPTPEIDAAFKTYESYKTKILNPTSAYEKAIAVIYITGAAESYISAVTGYYGSSKAGADRISSIVSDVKSLPTGNDTLINWVTKFMITSFGSPESQITAAKDMFDSTQAKILSPVSTNAEKVSAMSKITDWADLYIQAIKNYYGSGQAGVDLIAGVVNSVKSLPVINNDPIVSDAVTAPIPISTPKPDVFADVPTVKLAVDSGADNADAITNNATLVVTGTELNAKVEYRAAGTGAWLTTQPEAVQGFNTVFVRQTDVSGNVSDNSSFTFIFDTVIAPVTVAVSGIDAAHTVTKTATLTVTGIESAAVVIEFSTDSTDGKNGTWAIVEPTFVEGANSGYVRQTDEVGNISVGTKYSFTLDSIAPATNYPPTGNIIISGTASQNQTLTVSNTLMDANGLGTVSYQWLSEGIAVRGANQTTYALTQNDVGKNISVSESYTDGLGKLESVTSASVIISNVNDLPMGSVIVSGTTTQGQVLTASNSLADLDGLGAVSYQWLSGDNLISGASQTTYTLTANDVDKAISVKASYVDLQGTNESVTSGATALIVGLQSAPTGNVTITGSAIQGQTLTVSDNLADANGLGVINYQWLSNVTVISNQLSYALTQNDVGKNIRVTASYTDRLGKLESVTSSSVNVLNVNDLPTGSVTISGTTTQGQVLTATNSLADVDGLGSISYQWLNAGTPISGANQTTYTLTSADVGKAISVKASYTDLQNTPESVTSGATALIISSQSAPMGSVTISGTAQQNQTLNVSNTLVDANGLGVLSDQWFSDGGAISGATQSTYALTEKDVGKMISVSASYTDGLGKSESVSSYAVIIANVDDAPTGEVTITGEVKSGQTLTATNNLTDADGINGLIYQWTIDDEIVSDSNSITLTANEIGKSIHVVALYGDNYDNLGEVSSHETGVVINSNHAPTGKITVKGLVKVGSELSLSNTLKDADGLGDFNYQWLSNGVEIDSATQESYSLTKAEIGKKISVVVSYTDGLDNLESKTSTETVAVKAVTVVSVLIKTGTAKADKLSGLAGNDTLTGGLGADILTGGKGVDIFKFNSVKETGIDAKTRDTITDFKHSEKDKIDLSAIDANAKLAGDQAFTFIGSTAFNKTDASSQLRFDATSHILYGSTNADSKPEFSILLNGVNSLVAGDFVL